MTPRLSSAVNVSEQGRLFNMALSCIGSRNSDDNDDVVVFLMSSESVCRIHSCGYCGSMARLQQQLPLLQQLLELLLLQQYDIA